MKVLYNWLKEFADAGLSLDDLAARLPMCGLPVESREDSPAGPLLDLEIFSNRGDLLGHYGVAREVAAIGRTRLKAVNPQPAESREAASAATRVDIECPDLCGRFTARVLRGVKVQPSPDWLRQRLEALGQQSINNIVDATNYVMLELGHALHAFDMDKLAERRIVVRRARKGEKLRTLDGIERALTPEMCMVCDARRATGIGGVMGGAETEIGLATRNVLLECAWFDSLSVRRTARALGLRTEASMRFERGADPDMAEVASRRCAELILQLAGGELLAGVVDAYPRPPERQKIEVSRKEILRVMGADVPDRDVEEILTSLGFEPLRVDANRGSTGSLMAAWECRRPAWRHDVTREIDLVEEVVRHYGYDKFPARLPASRQPATRLPHAAADDAIRERLLALGFLETVSIPLVDPTDDAVFRREGAAPAALGNPLAQDASILRTSGVVNMLHALEWNINRGQHSVRLFEIGRSYELRGGKPVETPILTLGATGLAREKSVHEAAREYSFEDLKGELDQLGEVAGGFAWRAGAPGWLSAAHSGVILSVNALAGRSLSSAKSSASGKGASAPEAALGVAGQLARRVTERFKLRQDVLAAELLLEPLYAGWQTARAALRYAHIPRFPAVERDLSLVLADGTSFAQVAEVIRGVGIAELTSIEAVDLFRGGQIPMGKYSLLVRVTFASAEATFTEAQLADFHARIVRALEGKLGATLRAS